MSLPPLLTHDHNSNSRLSKNIGNGMMRNLQPRGEAYNRTSFADVRKVDRKLGLDEDFRLAE